MWLQIISIFGYIWNVVMITRIADSAGAEVLARGIYSDDKPGFGVGLGMSIMRNNTPVLIRAMPLNVPSSPPLLPYRNVAHRTTTTARTYKRL